MAYYLVHSLGVGDFRERDRRLAEGFGRAAAAAGVGRIVYLGGLGDDPESEHLASRQEVGAALASGERRRGRAPRRGRARRGQRLVRDPALPHRAAAVHDLPALGSHRDPADRAERRRSAISSAAIDVEPATYEIGGADVTTYREMIAAYADARGLRRRLIVDIPYLTPRLSSYWLDLVTPVDRHVSHALVESLVTEVVVGDRARTDAAFGIEPMGLVDALTAALDDQAACARPRRAQLGERAPRRHLRGSRRGRRSRPTSPRVSTTTSTASAGATTGTASRSAWRARALLGRLVGEAWPLEKPPSVREGDTVDWWTVTRREPGTVVLRSRGWFPGEGWLGYRIDEHELVQVGALRPKGVPGFVYWKALQAVHRQVFAALARHRVERAGGELVAAPKRRWSRRRCDRRTTSRTLQ